MFINFKCLKEKNRIQYTEIREQFLDQKLKMSWNFVDVQSWGFVN